MAVMANPNSDDILAPPVTRPNPTPHNPSSFSSMSTPYTICHIQGPHQILLHLPPQIYLG